MVRIREANWDLRAHVQRDPGLAGMSTTLTGLFLAAGDEMLLAHSGDSRGYRLRAGELVRMTRDDSYVQALVDAGMIPATEASMHPRRNIITASLGGGEDDSVTVRPVDLRAGDRWLLCSDGVTDYVPEADIADLLGLPLAPSRVAAAVVELALEAGTRDNATAVVCDVRAGVSRPSSPVFAGSAAARFAEDVETA
jgi:PPM family protein phosphatase